MTTPYTYLLKHHPTNSYYYGVRYAKGCHPDDFWVSYKTSSTYVKQLIREYGEGSFSFEIRKTFNEVNLARTWETKVLRRLKVVMRKDFINKTDNTSISPEHASLGMKGRFGLDHPAYGKARPDVSERNSKQTGAVNPMFGKVGELASCYGRTGEKHPMFGTKRPEQTAHMQQEVKCPHCGKIGKLGGMQRWHFNNCKFKGEYK